MSIYSKQIKLQSGAALFVCLMLLTVMTLLGLSAISGSTLEEKMAGNVRNKHLSFQAAEAALRAGETAADTVLATAFNDAGTGGFYNRSTPGDTSPKPTFPVWEQSGVNWQNATSANAGLVQSPQYIVEDFGTAYRDADCSLIVPLPAGCELPVYRVTAQGWGLNTNSSTMIQSTYKQL